jgi:WD40 repeat protein
MRRIFLSATAGALVVLLSAVTGGAAPSPQDAGRAPVAVPSPVRAVAVSPDGKCVAAGCDDKAVRLYDAATGKELAALMGHAGPVRLVAFSPDGKTLTAVGVPDKEGVEVRLWDIATRKATGKPVNVACSVRALALSPDAGTLASGTGGQNDKINGVGLYDVTTGEYRKGNSFLQTSYFLFVNGVAFSPDGKRVAACCEVGPFPGFPPPGHMAVWDVAGGKVLHAAGTNDPSPRAIAYNSAGKSIAVADSGGVSMWDVGNEKPRLRLTERAGGVSVLAFSPDGKQIATGSGLGVVRRYDAATGKETGPLRRVAGAVTALAFAPDGRTLVAGAADGNGGSLRFLDSADGIHDYFFAHPAEVYGLAVSPSGRTLVSASDKVCWRWDLSTARELPALAGHADGTWAAAFSPDGKTVATGGREWDVIRLFDAASGKESAVFKGDAGRIKALAFSPDGKTLASAGNCNRTDLRPGRLVLWDMAAGGKERAALRGHTAAVADVAFSPDGKSLASASWDGTVRLWDMATGKELLTIKAHPEAYAVRFTPDGKALVSGGGVFEAAITPKTPGEVKLWDVATGKEVAHLEGHLGRVSSVAVSPDGKWIASAGFDGTVFLWDAATRKERWRVKGHAPVAAAVVFLPDGKTVASGGWDHMVRLWDVATGKERLRP